MALANIIPPPDADNLDIEIPAAWRRRRAAAWRLVPFDDLGHRDPLDLLADDVRDIAPFEKFGLSEQQRRRHANELATVWHWSIDEIRSVLGIEPRAVA